MTDAKAIADHWGRGDVYGLITSALAKASKPLAGLTVEDLAPVDHFHARGFPATVELADRLPIKPGDHILDIGCGLGGPARYIAQRFRCRVSGLDITELFVDAANKLTALLRMDEQVQVRLGDGQELPYPDACFDGAYAQHVTMNVPDRRRFFAEAYRVLRPGSFFALTEHGLGSKGNPHHPVPWSEDGSGAYLISPEETRALLEGGVSKPSTSRRRGPSTWPATRWRSRRPRRVTCRRSAFTSSWATRQRRRRRMRRAISRKTAPAQYR